MDIPWIWIWLGGLATFAAVASVLNWWEDRKPSKVLEAKNGGCAVHQIVSDGPVTYTVGSGGGGGGGTAMPQIIRYRIDDPPPPEESK